VKAAEPGQDGPTAAHASGREPAAGPWHGAAGTAAVWRGEAPTRRARPTRPPSTLLFRPPVLSSPLPPRSRLPSRSRTRLLLHSPRSRSPRCRSAGRFWPRHRGPPRPLRARALSPVLLPFLFICRWIV
jgi:hypothetical protein